MENWGQQSFLRAQKEMCTDLFTFRPRITFQAWKTRRALNKSRGVTIHPNTAEDKVRLEEEERLLPRENQQVNESRRKRHIDERRKSLNILESHPTSTVWEIMMEGGRGVLHTDHGSGGAVLSWGAGQTLFTL